MSKGTWQAVVIQQKTKRSDYKPIIAQSGMKDVPIGLLFGLWFNNYAPITCLVRTFMDENTSISKILYLFLDTIQRNPQFICHFLTSYHRVRYNHIYNTLSCSTNRFIGTSFYRVLFEGTISVYRVLFLRTIFVYRVLFEGAVYSVGYFFNRYSSVFISIQIIESGVEGGRFRLILWFFARQEIRQFLRKFPHFP